jgi:hypothetical protein
MERAAMLQSKSISCEQLPRWAAPLIKIAQPSDVRKRISPAGMISHAFVGGRLKERPNFSDRLKTEGTVRCSFTAISCGRKRSEISDLRRSSSWGSKALSRNLISFGLRPQPLERQAQQTSSPTNSRDGAVQFDRDFCRPPARHDQRPQSLVFFLLASRSLEDPFLIALRP